MSLSLPELATSSMPGYHDAAGMKMNNAEFDELFRRKSAGDWRAEAELYELSRRMLERCQASFSRKFGIPPDLLTDTVALAITRAWEPHESGASYVPWLLAIFKNTWMDGVRKVLAGKRGFDKVDRLSGQDIAGSDRSRIAEISIDLKRCIEALSSRHRIVIQLLFFEGYTIAQAKESQTGWNIFRLKREAVEQLKKCLGPSYEAAG